MNKAIDELDAQAQDAGCLELLPPGETPPEQRVANRACPYIADENGLTYLKPTRDGATPVPLTNFTAIITAEVVVDDGVETTRHFEVLATLDGRQTTIKVPASQFASMNWTVEHLGSHALIFPGQGPRDHARAAIQMLSGRPEEKRVFAHTGWKKLDGTWAYLHNAGAIGPNGPVEGVQVDLRAPLDQFELPIPPADEALKARISDVLNLMRLAPDQVMVPVLAAVFRSVLGPADFSLHLAGCTGAGKSEIAALAQQHFGAAFSAKHLPGAWSSTANANELLAFSAKDALLVMDDFAPAGGHQDVNKMHREADRLLRAQGNRSGRQRARPDGSLRPVKAPRGLILSTGEDVPRTHSIQARMLIIEVGPKDVNWDALTGFQQQAADGVFAAAMAGYIRWVAGRYDGLHSAMPEAIREFRTQAAASGQHRRTPDIVANLMLGFHTFMTFALDVGAITAEERAAYQDRVWKALGEAGEAQAEQQASTDPVHRFIELLRTAISSGHAHVASGDGPHTPGQAWGWRERRSLSGDRESLEIVPQGNCIGWVAGPDLYLDQNAAYKVAQDIASGTGDSLAISIRTLGKRLKERGLLATTDEARGKLTVRHTLAGSRRDVLHFKAATIQEIDRPKCHMLTDEPVMRANTADLPAREIGNDMHSADSVADVVQLPEQETLRAVSFNL